MILVGLHSVDSFCLWFYFEEFGRGICYHEGHELLYGSMGHIGSVRRLDKVIFLFLGHIARVSHPKFKFVFIYHWIPTWNCNIRHLKVSTKPVRLCNIAACWKLNASDMDTMIISFWKYNDIRIFALLAWQTRHCWRQFSCRQSASTRALLHRIPANRLQMTTEFWAFLILPWLITVFASYREGFALTRNKRRFA